MGEGGGGKLGRAGGEGGGGKGVGVNRDEGGGGKLGLAGGEGVGVNWVKGCG